MSHATRRCESCDRLREANRRLQAEGPALERDKVIATLTAQRDEARAERNAERMARDADFEEMARLRAKLYWGGMCNVNHDTMNERLDAARALAAETVEALERADHRIGCSLTIVYDGTETVPCDCGLHSLAAKWREWSGGQ